jgi:hypothetical protein
MGPWLTPRTKAVYRFAGAFGPHFNEVMAQHHENIN